jgi:hypothetical protein
VRFQLYLKTTTILPSFLKPTITFSKQTRHSERLRSKSFTATRRWLSIQSPVSNAEESVPANVSTTTKPYFRVYYNDVYEGILPPRHRFPMQKYAQVLRTLFQKWVSELSPEERAKVDCGTFHEFHEPTLDESCKRSC